jgi:hypothetical protein
MIYCVTAREVGRVKIGFSNDPFGRFSKLQSDSPVALEIEHLFAGGVEDEAELHVRFALHRVRGEWFSLAPEIVEWMATLPGVVRPERATPVTDLSAAVGISASYSSMILSGKQRPSRPLAIHILRQTGWRHSSITTLSDDQIDMLETVEPWKPRASPSSDRKAA